MSPVTLLLGLLLLLGFASAGDGRFNKAYCLRGAAWGNASFWAALARAQTHRVAQFSAVNASGSFWLAVTPAGHFFLSPSPANVTLDLGCNLRSAPAYFAISYGSYGAGPVAWAAGPIGDSSPSKRARCWWVRCSADERESDTCGSEGEAPCIRVNATFLRYGAPGRGGPPAVDESCYPITSDSQMDPLHRVDFRVAFVDGLWPPPPNMTHNE